MADTAICSIDGCNNHVLIKSRGWCGKHYQRWQHTGDPKLSRINREQTGKPCSVDGCGGKSGHHGMCAKHHKRLLKRGTVDEAGLHPAHRRRVKWIHGNVGYKGDECLHWPFSVGDRGRGIVTVNGQGMSAPRYMCTLAHGAPPAPEYEAAHSCGKGHEGCINPRHLGWKTTSANRMDMVDHGTLPRGQMVNTAKLSAEQVREIRRIGTTKSRKATAQMFGVSYWTIWEIQTRRSWAWLD